MTLFNSMDITSSGMDAHAARVRIAATNVANMATPNFKRQIPILVQQGQQPFEQVMQQIRQGNTQALKQQSVEGVSLLGVVEDPSLGKKLYQPEHPQADAEGYITLSNSNPLADMADAMMANRMYEANLSMFSILRTMANKAIDAGSGR
ncbi:MAG: flagellar basal body rod protein FlgC [Vampirovibrionales bacterium]